MAYEQRLKWAKIAATAVLVIIAGLCLSGADYPRASAERALLGFGLLTLVLGLVLCWSKLHGTGRGIRMAMYLVMGTVLVALYTLGPDIFMGGTFLAAFVVTGLSIKR